ncbi:glycosyltransferase family protein [Shimia sp. MMG029]|uniref:glycosyltransferase family protein n=1 Tax=Shimia sp. MMG029 TaxID=3021978 RepID=UPI0022FEA6AF|nr:glycosyltransferase [Shimia sp. MMG029]MDA5557538.1 glycosyltransferase [Shimia sp. MMG029]
MKVLIAVTHLLGTGHLARAMTLARAFVKGGHEVVVLSGGRPAPHLTGDDVPVVQLPSLASDGVDFSKLMTDLGVEADAAYLASRRNAMVHAVAEMQPDVVITELFPFGRRSLADEFRALLEAARDLAPRPVVLASVRDILAPPSKARKAALARDMLREFYDAVLVHSDPDLTRLEVSWPVTTDVSKKLRYTGYVAPAAPEPTTAGPGAGEVLVSAGGGSVGQALFECAILAAKRSPLRWRLLVGGADKEERIAALRAQANDPMITIEPVRPDFRQLLNNVTASVSMCGYNTALDVLQTGVPAVFVPFDDGGEVEQTLRARALSAQPGIEILSAADLSPETLMAEVKRAVAHGRRSASGLRMNGAAETVRIAEDMLASARA